MRLGIWPDWSGSPHGRSGAHPPAGRKSRERRPRVSSVTPEASQRTQAWGMRKGVLGGLLAPSSPHCTKAQDDPPPPKCMALRLVDHEGISATQTKSANYRGNVSCATSWQPTHHRESKRKAALHWWPQAGPSLWHRSAVIGCHQQELSGLTDSPCTSYL